MRKTSGLIARALTVLTLAACGRDLPRFGTGSSVDGLQFEPPSFELYRGQAFSFEVISTRYGESRSVLGDPALRVEATSDIVTVEADGTGLTLLGGSSSIHAEHEGLIADADVAVRNAALLGIEVEPDTISIRVRESRALRVTGVLSDGTRIDLTSPSSGTTYASGAPGIALVSGSGLVSGVAMGDTFVRVVHANFSDDIPLQVSRPEPLQGLEITPRIVTLEFGQSEQLSMTGVRSDGSRVNPVLDFVVTLSSNDDNLASVSAHGTVTAGNQVGFGIITAQLDNLTSAAEIQVRPPEALLSTIDLSIGPVAVPLRSSVQVRVTGHYRDGSRADLRRATTGTTYRSLSPPVFTVSADGLVTGASTGRGRLLVNHGRFQEMVDVDVIPEQHLVAIQALPNPVDVQVGGSVQLIVDARFDDGSIRGVASGSLGTGYTPPGNGIISVTVNGWVMALSPGAGNLRVGFGGLETSIPISVSR